MLSKTKRKQLSKTLQSYRVEISWSTINEGACRSLEIGNIWGIAADNTNEIWAFDYNECSYNIILIGPEMALMDSDGGYDSAWFLLEEVFQKFYKSYKDSLSAHSDISKLLLLFLKKLFERDEGFVYFLQKQESENIYKIGRSKSYQERIRKLEVKLPFDVVPLLIFKSSEYKKSEKLLHSFFSNKRLNGEWFSLDHKDIELLNNAVFCSNMLLEKVVVDQHEDIETE